MRLWRNDNGAFHADLVNAATMAWIYLLDCNTGRVLASETQGWGIGRKDIRVGSVRQPVKVRVAGGVDGHYEPRVCFF
ncbi:hypothetical protein [Allokutzneria albata]|uniref:hypothetical protein n=1 Tax=Allokutzneria albata TaxID=211114 RepID=UPI00138E54FC|nr:hypothetical protein [Allokutzneria albata]